MDRIRIGGGKCPHPNKYVFLTNISDRNHIPLRQNCYFCQTMGNYRTYLKHTSAEHSLRKAGHFTPPRDGAHSTLTTNVLHPYSGMLSKEHPFLAFTCHFPFNNNPTK